MMILVPLSGKEGAMLVEILKNQWICSCGNWVDRQLSWCPDCCEERVAFSHETEKYDEVNTMYTH